MANHNSARAFILSQAEARKRKADRAGWSLIAACVLGFAGIFGAAYQHDSRIKAERIEAAKADRVTAEEAKASGASAIMDSIAGELRKSGCTVTLDSPATYTVERC